MTSEGTPRPFHERFDVNIGIEEAKRRFINRIHNSVFNYVEGLFFDRISYDFEDDYYALLMNVADALGERYSSTTRLMEYVRTDFHRCLEVLEALHQAVQEPDLKDELSDRICRALGRSETNLSIDWHPPKFIPTGARYLDDTLVNEPLHWLSDRKYTTVYEPFSKGLSHFLEAKKKPELLADVITDMYEAVEALAKITNNNDRELSRNRESFIKNIRASNYHKQLLKDYIEYAGKFRHAARTGQPKPPLSEPEVESFIYLTGLFIRLAIQTAQPSP